MIVLRHDRIFILLDTVPERDGPTDRQTDGRMDGRNPSAIVNSALHCKQRGRAVKTVKMDGKK